jgi:hypothetical protein
VPLPEWHHPASVSRSPAGRWHVVVSRRRWRRSLAGVAVAALALSPLASTGSAAAGTAKVAATKTSNATPELWPKLAPFKTLVVASLNDSESTSDELLAATTLEGAYNQLQGPNRLYVVRNPDDQTWLNDNVLRGVRWSALQGEGSGPAGQLDALLADYGHDIKGAILINPSDPDTINLATTMAGIDDAMVADPSQVPLLQQYGIPVIYSFADTTFTSPQAAYQWGMQYLLPESNRKDLVILSPGDYGELRDYIVATKSFVFDLNPGDPSQEPVMNEIITSRPVNTPILGYIGTVADLSSLGHFLNASDLLDNESDWAAVPSLPRLVQPKPQPVQADKNTVYVAFLVSDGDNAQYVEHQMFDTWTAGTDLAAVPEGWTLPPGMADYTPSLISWFYRNLPRNSELLAGPSGVGWVSQEKGRDLREFARLSASFMRRDSMTSVDNWEPGDQIPAYAYSSGLPTISFAEELAYMQEGRTAVIGQTNGYTYPSSALLTTIEQDVVAQPTTGKPIFLQPLVDGWNEPPQDILAIAQALAKWGKTVSKDFVFTTPSELGLSEEAYYQGHEAGLPPLNAQAVSGASLLQLPPAGQLQGYTAPSATGPDLVTNPGGQDGTDGWSATAGSVQAGTYDGGPDLTWSVPTTEPAQEYVSTYPAVQDGDNYVFSVRVAGSGQVFLDAWTGTGDLQSPAIKLQRSYQTITWAVSIPSNAPSGQTGNAPQLEVREVGIQPVTVHIKDATVQSASAAASPAMTHATILPANGSQQLSQQPKP